MLERVLEPELMDTVSEARDYDAMDHRAVYRVFVDDFFRLWNGAGTILDVGTGTAQIPILLCQRHAEVDIIAIDNASEMLKLGAANLARAGLAKRIRLQQCDAKHMPFVANMFGAVISNSIVHHIAVPGRVLREITRVVRPGGWLFVRDLLRPGSDEEVKLLVQTYTGQENPHQQQMFEASLRAALSLEEIRREVLVLGFPPEGVRQTTDRHWTWCTQRPAGH
jgi:ubiquinone/menaquinone biosynthesis C-methylase UbiE